LNSLYQSQFVTLDTMNHSMQDCLDKVELSVKNNFNKLNPHYFLPRILEGSS